MDELIQSARALREKFQKDPYRPAYHFVIPEGIGWPFDPNGAIFWKGKYHLFYIYEDKNLGRCWGHASSVDLFHWRFHPVGLAPMPGDVDTGINSGGAFLDKNGVPTIIYFGIKAGICIAQCEEDDLINWVKSPHNPVIPLLKEGDPRRELYGVFDPHCWLEGDTYYVGLGNITKWDKNGDTLFLFKSDDLINWKFLHPMYQSERKWTELDDDCACPDFFKLGNTRMLLFISHERGAQYYLGRWENETFYPERHALMNGLCGGPLFATESLLDDKGRRIFWGWVFECCDHSNSGWSGVMSMPRILSLAEDGAVLIQPVLEIERLRIRPRSYENLTVTGERVLEGVCGDCLELSLEIAPSDAAEYGVKVRCSPDWEEQTVITYNPKEKTLSVDTNHSRQDETSTDDFVVHKLLQRPRSVQVLPLELASGEPLKLRIFLDKSILEVFANDRQCLTARIYPKREDSMGIRLFSKGGSTKFRRINAWDIAPSNCW
jgi:sucrose-6-phosphate hydrolase SacC (GH32 family)